MPRNQKNFAYFTYVDDNGDTWNKRGESGGGTASVDGSAPYTPGARVWSKNSTRFHVRYAIAKDPGTHRSLKFIIYTPTAFGLLTAATTISKDVAGSATPVVYQLAEKIPEKQPIATNGVHLADS